MDTTQAPSNGSPAHAGRPPQTLQTLAEILGLLTELRDQGCRITLNGRNGEHAACTLWSIDSSSARLGFSADAADPQLSAIVQHGSALAQTQLDGVLLDFDLHGLVVVRGTQSSSLQASLPRAINRHQRRDSFRVRTAPRSGPVITVPNLLRGGTSLALRVLDLSIGGCCVAWPQDVPAPAEGSRLSSAKVELMPGTQFTAHLIVRWRLAAPTLPGLRLGCEWQSLDVPAQRVVQRHIDDAQRRWRAALSA